MDAAPWPYAGYLLWLGAGWLDFAHHRRTDLAHTSGLRESSLHAVQLALLGVATLAWLSWQPSLLLLAMLSALVACHALVGYADTRVAFPRRCIGPGEQHVHSILDMAPWFALCAIVVTDGAQAREAGWALASRDASVGLWLAVLLPPLPLCILPWLLEYRAAWHARGA